MKHEQVVPDYWVMLKSSGTCLLLVFSGYILIRMIQAIFWLPGYLEENQKKLEQLVTKYADNTKSNEDENIEGIDENKINNTDNIQPNEKKKEK